MCRNITKCIYKVLTCHHHCSVWLATHIYITLYTLTSDWSKCTKTPEKMNPFYSLIQTTLLLSAWLMITIPILSRFVECREFKMSQCLSGSGCSKDQENYDWITAMLSSIRKCSIDSERLKKFKVNWKHWTVLQWGKASRLGLCSWLDDSPISCPIRVLIAFKIQQMFYNQ